MNIKQIISMYHNIPVEYRDKVTVKNVVYDSLTLDIRSILDCYIETRKEQEQGIYPDSTSGIRNDVRWELAQLNDLLEYADKDAVLKNRDIEFLLELADEVGGFI